MIAYEELVTALTNWRARQGLPTGHTDFLGPPPAHLATTIIAQATEDVEEIAADSLVEEISEVDAYETVGDQTDVAVALDDDEVVEYGQPAAEATDYDYGEAAPVAEADVYEEAPAAFEEAPAPIEEAPAYDEPAAAADELGYGDAATELGYGDASGEIGSMAPPADDYADEAPTAIADDLEQRADTNESPFDDDDEATVIASAPSPDAGEAVASAPAAPMDESTMDVDIEADGLEVVDESDAPPLPGADIATAPMEMIGETSSPPPLAPPPDEPTMDVDFDDVVEEEPDPKA